VPFDPEALRRRLPDLRRLTLQERPGEFLPELLLACASVGVAVAFVPAPNGCHASGAARWLTPSKALVVLSHRYRANDHLWFTFFHEIAHILHHGKKRLFIDWAGLTGEHEDEANSWAADFLIPRQFVPALKAVGRSREGVLKLAQRIGVAPGIVVGRMQKDGLLPWSRLNELKTRYEWHTPAPKEPRT